MGKFKLIIFVLMASASFYTCKDDLLDTNPYNAIGSEQMWRTESQANAGVIGVYNILRLGQTGNGFYAYDAEAFAGMPLNKASSFLTTSQVLTNNGVIGTYWQQNYEGIHRANDAIFNLEKKKPLDSVENLCRIAECKFLRGWYYYNLNQVFKGVPVYLEPVTIDECIKGRETETKVWETIIADLTACIDEPNLPVFHNTATEYGRATKAAAYALRGKVYIWMKMWTQAEADLRMVGTLGPKLYTGYYKKLFKTENEKNPEMIFSVQNIAVQGLGAYTQQNLGTPVTYGQGWNYYLPNPDLVESFEEADGSPFNWDDYLPGYNSMTPAQRVVFFLRNGLTTAEFNKFKNAGADMTKYMTTGNEERLKPVYEDRDPRLSTLVITPYSTFTGYFSGTINTYTLRWPYRPSDSSPPYDLRYNGNNYFYYVWRKWVYEGTETTAQNTYGPTDQPLIRYADVILLLAEAINEQRFDEEAVALVNSVRSRAGHIPLQTSDAGLPTFVPDQDNLRERIRNERRWELACEGIDLFDEMRWMTWKEKKFYSGNGIKQIHGSVVSLYNTWQGDYIYKWPIPKTEVERNRNIIQNDGWID